MVRGGVEAVAKSCSRAKVEVLRASPVNTTGVQTPDLVGCAQDDTM
jgi:hypothetical protein